MQAAKMLVTKTVNIFYQSKMCVYIGHNAFYEMSDNVFVTLYSQGVNSVTVRGDSL